MKVGIFSICDYTPRLRFSWAALSFKHSDWLAVVLWWHFCADLHELASSSQTHKPRRQHRAAVVMYAQSLPLIRPRRPCSLHDQRV